MNYQIFIVAFSCSSNKLNYLYSKESRVLPTNEVKEFITIQVVMKVLSRQLAAVNQNALIQVGSLEKLVEFVQESFKAS